MKSQGEFYYEKVKEVCSKFIDEYAVVEIGTDGGTTAFWAMKALKELGSARWFFTIDPYGDKPYKAGSSTMNSMGYNDARYMDTVSSLYKYAKENSLNYLHWKLTSLDWIKIIPKVEFWNDGRATKDPKICFAYLDGDHHFDPVEQEFAFFYKRIPVGGVICIDDYNLLGDGTETNVRQKFEKYAGDWYFNTDDNHYRCYFTKK